MPIYSMTGFARVQVRVPIRDQDQLAYTLTLKSVNHRFLDVQLRLPSGLDALEMELRRLLKESLVRGHVELTLSVERGAQQVSGYNRDLVAGYLSAFIAAREEHGLAGQPDLNAVFRDFRAPCRATIRKRAKMIPAALSESALQRLCRCSGN